VLGALLLVLSLTSILQTSQQVDERKVRMAIRQIGHEYLLSEGDEKSTVPAVEKSGELSFVLPLARAIEYDSVMAITQQVLAKFDLKQPYSLALLSCGDGQEFLGAFFDFTTNTRINSNLDEAACRDRDQEARCANLSLQLHPEDPGPGTGFYLGLLVGLSFLLIGPVLDWSKPGKESTLDADVPRRIALGPGAFLLPDAQRLQWGKEERELTYRECKLLTYLAEHPNGVLEREKIHDAVWGDEGIMVGRSLDVFISRLRKKLAEIDTVKIETVHGVGYRFRVG
jgi:hypothetical protein